MGKYVDDKTFIKTYQASTSIKSVAAALGLGDQTVRNRAKKLNEAFADLGLETRLKTMSRPARRSEQDIRALANLVESL